MKSQKIADRLLSWFATHARELPWRRTRDPYAIWVSEIMLQQTQVKTVVPFWERWTRGLPNVEALAKAKPQTIHKLWEGLGYYTRVRNMQKAAQTIVSQHGGRFPRSFEAVLALPGIGRYTAGAICSIAFNQPRPILDGNVIRVLARLFGIRGDPRSKPVNARLWKLAEELVQSVAGDEWRVTRKTSSTPSGSFPSRAPRPSPLACSHLNQSLMELGALVCTPRLPLCHQCPVARHCLARREACVDELPELSRRPRVTPRRFVAFVAQRRERFLVRQRPSGVVNAHLWEFPNIEVTKRNSSLRQAAHAALGASPVAFESLFTIKHSITRYRITLEVFRAVLHESHKAVPANAQWLGRTALTALPFASAHKKILAHVTT